MTLDDVLADLARAVAATRRRFDKRLPADRALARGLDFVVCYCGRLTHLGTCNVCG